MKQYLNSEQTAKLIELGFEKPKSEVKAEQAGDCVWYNPAYSIGELIEMLPKRVKDKYGRDSFLYIVCFYGIWRVKYEGYRVHLSEELIDALYYMILQLKEEKKL